MSRYFLFFFALAFDYKGVDEGGGIYQFASFTLAVLSGGYILAQSYGRAVKSKTYVVIRNLFFIFLISTVLVSLIQGVEFDRYIRISLPYYLLVLGYLVGACAIVEIGFHKVIRLVRDASFIAIVFTIIYGMVSSGNSIHEIRYQILSPMIYILLPILGHQIFIEKKYVILAGFVMVGIMVLIIASATRSWLIAYFGVVFLAIALPKAKSFVGLIKAGSVGLLGLALFSAILLPAFMLVMPDEIERLTDRIFIAQVVGFDITTATRIAEMDYQINAWLVDIPTIILGNGLGASYGFSGDSLTELVYLFGASAMDIDYWFAGHNFWIYSFFTQGIIFGWVVPGIILYVILLLLKIVKSASGDVSSELLFRKNSCFFLCLLVFFSFVLSTIGGNPLGSRMLSQYIGVFIVVAIAMANAKPPKSTTLLIS